MRRAFVLSLVAFGLIVAGLGLRSGPVLALALPLVVYLAAGVWQTPGTIDLDVRRTLSAGRVAVNMPVDVTLTVTNNGPALDELLVQDDVPANLAVSDGSARHLVSLAAGQTASWTYTVRGARGYYTFPSIHVQARDPLGLVKRDRAFAAPVQLFVLPPIIRLKYVAIRPRRTRVYSGLVPVRAGGPGAEFYGVREYQAGDPPRWINWRASARHQATLYSNEFEQERVTDIGMVLDVRQRANLVTHGNSLFEYSALAAAALSDVLLAQGNRVGLLLYGRMLKWTVPGYGRVQRERILRAVAQAEPGSSEVFADLEELPTRLFPAHSQVILISPLLSSDVKALLGLRARGYQLMVISPDPVAFELSFLPERRSVELAGRVVRLQRELLLAELRRAGVQVINWNVTVPFEQVAQRHLSRPAGWLRDFGGL